MNLGRLISAFAVLGGAAVLGGLGFAVLGLGAALGAVLGVWAGIVWLLIQAVVSEVLGVVIEIGVLSRLEAWRRASRR